MSKNITTLDNSATALATAKVTAAGEMEAQVAKPIAQALSGDFCGDRSIVTISNSPGEGGKDAVFVGVSGVGFQLPRGKPWNVPVEVASVLRDANETSYSRDEKTGEVIVTQSPRYSFIAQDLPKAALADAS
jgi:hypothetical protein